MLVLHGNHHWDQSHSQELIYEEWKELLVEYSKCKLTRGTDKLPALSGLASVFAKRSRDSYCAGLWWTDLRRGLLWHRLIRVEREAP